MDRKWKSGIFTDETQVKIYDKNRVSVWRKTNKDWHLYGLREKDGRCVTTMFWGCVTYSGVGILTQKIYRLSRLPVTQTVLTYSFHTFYTYM